MRLEAFAGIDNASAAGRVPIGAAERMINFRVDEAGRLVKRPGLVRLVDPPEGAGGISAMWYGPLGGEKVLLYTRDGRLWRGSPEGESLIGAVGSEPRCIFSFSGRVYVLGGGYFVYDGQSLQRVAGYVPTVITAADPATGAGALLEEANLLNSRRRVKYSADGSARSFKIAEGFSAIEGAQVDGTEAQYTANPQTGTVTFGAAPAAGQSNVVITYTAPEGEQDDIIGSMKYASFYGGDNDTRVFFWGSGDEPAKIYNSGMADGLPSAEYLPASGFRTVGTGEYAVRDVLRDGENQLILTEKDAWYSFAETRELDGRRITTFPIYPLNPVRGSDFAATARVADDLPVSLTGGGMYLWRRTNVRNERSVELISRRAEEVLGRYAAQGCATADDERKKELIVASGGGCLVWNYGRDVFYEYRFGGAGVTALCAAEGTVYVGRADGGVLFFDDGAAGDCAEPFYCLWESRWCDFGAADRNKALLNLWAAVEPRVRVRGEISFRTDFSEGTKRGRTKEIDVRLSDFSASDFSDFSFSTFLSPAPIRHRAAIPRFCYLKTLIESRDAQAELRVISLNYEIKGAGRPK